MCRNNRNGMCDRFNMPCLKPCMYYIEEETASERAERRKRDIDALETELKHGKMGIKDK